MNVLFVDDEPAILEQAKIFLKREEENLDVETAVSAKEGLELLDKRDYDAIVSDYQMPRMDGLEFLETVREDRGSDIPFIIFTGKGREEVAIEALNLGANRYLRKGGNPKSQYGVLADDIIQEVKRKEAEEELRETEERFRSFINSTSDLVFLKNEKFRHILINEAYEEFLEKDEKEIIGKTDYDLLPEELADQCRKSDEKALEAGKTITTEESFDDRAFECRKFPVKLESGEFGLGGIVEEITERKEMEEEIRKSEEKFRRSFETIPDSVALFDEEGVVVDVNEASLRELGFEREEMIGSSLWDASFFPEETVEKTTKRFERRKKGEEIPPYPVELETKDGERIITEVNAGMFENNPILN